MSDTGAIDEALITRLRDDATLTSLLPGGVAFDDAPAATRFAVVMREDHVDLYGFDGRAIEEVVYRIEAVVHSKQANAGATARQAAARIDELLDRQLLPAVGYLPMALQREGPSRWADLDDVDPTAKWFHRGGVYRVIMSTT